MAIEIAFFNALRRLPIEIEAEIRSGIDDGIAAMKQKTSVDEVGIIAILDPYTSPETGLGGRHYGPDAMEIWIDEENPKLRIDARRNTASVVVHELHHVLRARKCPWRWYDLCAGEVIVREGLAVHCEVFTGFPEPLNVWGVSGDQLIPLFDRLAPIIDDPKADWHWIYQLNDLPSHVSKAMYPLGYQIVSRYFKETGKTPIEAMHTPWQDIWQIGKPAGA
jgi:uncharacterized protein YjaZ